MDDATGQPIEPDTIYRAVVPFTTQDESLISHVIGKGDRYRGSHKFVADHGMFFAKADATTDELPASLHR